MRVLLICAVYPPEIAPAGYMTKELAMKMAEMGHQVDIVTGWPNHPNGQLFPGYSRKVCQKESSGLIRVVRLMHFLPTNKTAKSRILYWASFALATFIYLLFSRRYDVVYSNTVPVFGPPLLLAASLLRRSKYVYGIYDIYPEAALEIGVIRAGLVYKVTRLVDSFVCRHAYGVRVIGQQQKNTLIARGVSGDRIKVIPLWFEKQRIEVSEDQRNSWRSKNQIPQNSVVFIYAGTIGLISGADVVVRAAKKLMGLQQVLFLFVGEGGIKSQLQEEAEKAKLQNIRFLPFQDENALGAMFASADVGLVTLLPNSGNNSIPSKVLGYLGAGLPVIACVDSNSDIAYYFGKYNYGCLTPAQSVDEFCAAVENLCESKTRERCSEQAKLCYDENFSREQGVRNCVKFLIEGSE